MKFRKAVFVVVYARNKDKIEYLILKRKLHWKGWEFPKGGVEGKESLKKAVARELFEETGLKPKKISSHKASGKFVYDSATQKERSFYGQTYKLFSVEVKDTKVKYDKIEHSGYKWLNFQEAIKLLTWQNQKKCLKTVNRLVKSLNN